MHRTIAFLLLQILVYQLSGQNSFSFHPPLDIPMVLSGNFGELRADHFHSGIDIKTNGTTGHPVYSIEEGYVSRIKVQANGYGKSIYIDHPGGYTSLYGHLDSYRDDIATFVRKMQYRHRSHAIDLYLEPGQFKIGKGDIIAYSGNTGGSSGPHLHFEIRTSGNQHPTNVLKYGFDIADHVAPRFYSLWLYPGGEASQVNRAADKQRFPVVRDNGVYKVPYGTRLRAGGKLGVGVEVFDYLSGAGNRCGVYILEMSVDGRKVYSHTMDEFDFSDTRYVNAHVDYEELISSDKKVHRLYRLPNDRLKIYGELVDNGWITVGENKKYQVRITAVDVAGNSSSLEFEITGDTATREVLPAVPDQATPMRWNEKNSFQSDEIKVDIPANALYQDIQFTCDKLPGEPGMLSDLYRIHSPGTPVHLPYTVSINYELQDPRLKEKLLLVTFNEDHDLVGAGGDYRDGAVVADLRNFGLFAVAADTTRPEIILQSGIDQADLSGTKEIRFTIRDNLSDIEDYQGYLDNQWALFEYDPKNDLLTYTFDKDRIQSGTLHDLELYVSDGKGNVNLYHTTFTW